MKKIFILGFFIFCNLTKMLRGENFFPENIVLENDLIRVILKKYQTYIPNSLVNKKTNSNLLSEIFIWYQGKSDKEDRIYEDLNERNFKLINIRKINNQKCIIESENVDFFIKKKVEIDKNKPLFTMTYIMEAKNNYSPRLKTFPLINLSSNFEKFYIWNWIENNVKEYSFKELKRKQLSKDENLVIMEDKDSKNFLCLFLNFQENEKIDYLVLEDANWCKRVSVNHIYDGWKRFLKKGEKIETKLVFCLLSQTNSREIRNEILKLFNISNSFHYLKKVEIEKKFPSPLSYKLIETPFLIIWHEISAKKVYPETKPPVNFGNTVKLTLAKNEGESFQLSIMPKDEITLSEIKISDFKNGKFVLNKDCFESYYLDYVEKESPLYGCERIPDKLIPLTQRLPFVLKRGNNHILWFTIYSPPDIFGGNYKGEVILKFLKQSKEFVYRIPVEINIWDFELPKKVPFRAFGLLWRYYLLPQYLPKNVSPEELDMIYIKTLAKYHINTDLISNSSQNRRKIFDGKEVNLREFENRAKEMIEKFNYNVLSIPNVYLGNWSWKKGNRVQFLNLDPYSEEFTSLFSYYLKEVSDLLEKNNWIDIAVLYIWDEIYGEDAYSLLENKLAKVIWKVNPKFQILIVGPPDKIVVKNCNIICPGDFTSWWNEKAQTLISSLKEEKKEIWVYLNSETFIPEQPASVTRLVLWKCFTRNITGYLQWCFDYWQDNFTSNGCAWLFHPTNTSYPLPSVRLEYFRDGIEDFTYFQIFKNLCIKKNKIELYKKFENELLVLVPLDSDPDYSKIEKIIKFRNKVGDLIEKITKE